MRKLNTTVKNEKWYKEKADFFDHQSNTYIQREGFSSDIDRMQVNYNLYDNILDEKYFSYICELFTQKKEKLPAKLTHKDIIAQKVNLLLGMELKRPFSFRLVNTNKAATTTREQEEFNKVREYVVSQVVAPIRQQITERKQMELQQQLQENPELQNDKEFMAQFQQEIEQEVQAMTPDRVKGYMEREYQEPSEKLFTQLLNHGFKDLDVKNKFNVSWKDYVISGAEFMYIGELNGKVHFVPLDPRRASYDMTNSYKPVQDREWFTYSYSMTPSEIINQFGEELTQKDIDSIYEKYGSFGSDNEEGDYFAIIETINKSAKREIDKGIPVIHVVWRAARKIGILTYLDEETGQETKMLVDEHYVLNKDFGDIEISWHYIPEVYETWKIKAVKDIYVYMRPIPGQTKDLNNLGRTPLPYFGNITKTSLVDRGKDFQYYYDMLLFRSELLIASDEGKKFLMNINIVPDKFTLTEWEHIRRASNTIWFNPNADGEQGYSDANTAAKVIDLSLTSDIEKYQRWAEYIRQMVGRAMGIPDSAEGQIGQYEAVDNVQQNMMQTSHILEPYFNSHNVFKRQCITYLMEVLKVHYSQRDGEKLVYMLDDLSKEIIKIDKTLLDNATMSLFIENSAKIDAIINEVPKLAHAALQNQTIELSDFLTLMEMESIVDAKEFLKIAETKRREAQQAAEQAQRQHEKELKQMEAEEKEKEFQRKLILQEDEYERKTKLELVKTGLLGASFNPDVDNNGNGVNDFLELARQGLDADMRVKAQALNEKTAQDKKDIENRKLDLEERKVGQNDRKLSIEEQKVKNISAQKGKRAK